MGRLPHYPRVAGRLLRALFALALAVWPARAEDVPVVVGGKEKGTVYLYKVGQRRYLDAKQAISAYGGSFNWQPVSGRVQLSVRGRIAALKVEGKWARVADGGVDLPEPVIVRANTVLVPLEFFTSKAFGDMTWSSTRLDDEKGLIVQPRGSVGPLRWHSYKDHSRIVLELDPQHTYSLSRRGRSGLDVTIPLGTVETAQEATLDDGYVATLRLWQESRLARLAIELHGDSPNAAWDAGSFGASGRLVIDIYHDDAAKQGALAGRRRKPEPVAGEASRPEATAAVVAAVVETAKAKEETPVLAAPLKRKIVVDPGHGGEDSGATGKRGVREKDVNLLAAKELARRLVEDGSFDVLLTRDTDVFVPLADRAKMANEFGADLFISLHCNANYKRSEKGFEIYFLSERASDPEAERVAERENASLALESGGGAADAEAALLLHAMARTEFINDAS
ncbi:MAG: N-acetylmuramoyl-L-alanine amidase, partial [Elusimicrobia bacterium]|nr:N-acetylmuramoyl-L-alanine amidase [Elusimicrobiota bacterium]